jgi:hypothetical protein
MGIFQQSAFEKQKGDVVLESTDQDDVVSLGGVAGLAPLQFFGQGEGKKDRPQFRGLFAPGFGFLEKRVNLWIHRGFLLRRW